MSSATDVSGEISVSRDGSGSMDYHFQQHGEQMMQQLYALYQSGKMCDVTIVVGGLQIPCHRVVLATSSHYFEAMFTTDMREKRQEVVRLQDLNEQLVEAVIDFCYTGHIRLDCNNVQRMMHVATFLQVEKIARCCELFIEERVDIKNAIEVRAFAHRYNRVRLLNHVDRHICDNFNEIAGIKLHSELTHDILRSILDSDKLNVPGELQVYERLMEWVRADLPRRATHLPGLLRQVRLSQVEPLELIDRISKEPLIQADPACKDHVLEACAHQLKRARHHSPLSTRPADRPRHSYAGIVLCVGGRGQLQDPYASAELFDPLHERWFTMDPMGKKRRHVGLVALGSRVYAIGGHDGVEHLASGEVYEPACDRWAPIAPMMTRRRGLALATLGECLFCLGGLDDIACFQTVERYDPAADLWSGVAPMQRPRGGLGAASCGQHIYALGGNDAVASVNSCERYDPVRNCWTRLEPMRYRRAGAAAVTLDGQVYVLGGFDDNAPLGSMERYDPRTDSWTTLAPMRSERGGVGVAALGGLIYAVGGHDGEEYLQSVEVYDPSMNQWREAPGINQRRAGAGVCFCPLPTNGAFRQRFRAGQQGAGGRRGGRRRAASAELVPADQAEVALPGSPSTTDSSVASAGLVDFAP